MFAGAREGVLSFGSGVASYLSKRACEVCVVCFCLVVVEGFEAVVFEFEVGRGRDGVGD